MRLNIDFAFEVGEEEKHHVAFHWGQVWGQVRITVDDVEVLHQSRPLILGSTLTRRFEVSVGESEVHAVAIEKAKKRFLGGARRQSCRAFVDGEVIGEY